MIQLYFLSILCNGLSGYILFAGNENEVMEKQRFAPIFLLVLGIMSAVTGILKLLSPTMDGILLLGDLVPAAAGVVAGIMLVFGLYRQSSPPTSTGSLDNIAANLMTFRKPIGLGLIASAILHFLFPQALFL
jgi:hypothetical protein